MKVIYLITLFLLQTHLMAVWVEIPRAFDTIEREMDSEHYNIHPSMVKYIGTDTKNINPKGQRIYRFHNAKIGSFFLCGDSDAARWEVVDKQDRKICHFTIYIFPCRQEAMKKAVEEPPLCPLPSFCEKYIEVFRDQNYTYIRYRKHKNRVSPTHTIGLEKNGVLLNGIVWTTKQVKLPIEQENRLLREIIDVVLSGKPQENHGDELHEIRERNHEQRLLQEYPSHRMSRNISNYYRSRRIWLDLPEGDRIFKDPQIMWNRPSREWMSQFIHEKERASFVTQPWNERGDMVAMNIPKGRTNIKIRCYIAHAVSKYDSLRFMEGFAYAESVYDPTIRESCIQNHRVNPRLIGEYDLALKPQLDDSGALIPNSEESDICFVRNNTAVRVVADRPDVSVLWIAEKIDEELIAAGKGEPPTWSPPRKRTPASAARQQPIAVPSKQH